VVDLQGQTFPPDRKGVREMTNILSSNLRALFSESNVLKASDVNVACEIAASILTRPDTLTAMGVVDCLIAIQEMSLSTIKPAVEDALAMMNIAMGPDFKYDATDDNTQFGQMYKVYEMLVFAVENLKLMRTKLANESIDEVLNKVSMPSAVMDMWRLGLIETDADLMVVVLLADKMNGFARNKGRSSVKNWVTSYLSGNIDDYDEDVSKLLVEIGWTGDEVLTAHGLVALTIATNQVSLQRLEAQMGITSDPTEKNQLKQSIGAVTAILEMWADNLEEMTQMMQERLDQGWWHVFVQQGLPDPGLEGVKSLTSRQYLSIYFYLSKNR
jgi:hypothetical protein